jgi:hypothetical protein
MRGALDDLVRDGGKRTQIGFDRLMWYHLVILGFHDQRWGNESPETVQKHRGGSRVAVTAAGLQRASEILIGDDRRGSQ